MEESPEGSTEAEGTTNQSVAMTAPQQRNTVEDPAGDPRSHCVDPAHVNGSHQQHIPEQRNVNEKNKTDPSIGDFAHRPEDPPLALGVPQQPVSRTEETKRDLTEGDRTAGLDAAQESGSSKHSKLCAAIMQMTSASAPGRLELKSEIQNELHRDSDLVRRPCPRPNCQRHPIHVAIRNKSYEALELLLDAAVLSDLSIPCPGCGGRTAVEEACESPGDVQVLNLFKRYLSGFSVTKEFYLSYKNRVGRWAGEALKELSKTPVQKQWPPKEGFLQRILTGKTNRSM
jgi:hypothetical protein